MSNFESLLGRRYLQRTHRRPRIFWIGLVGLVLGVVAMLASSALKKHAESIANTWHEAWWLSWLGQGNFEIEFALTQVSYLAQIVGLAVVIIAVFVVLFGMLNWRFTTFSAFSTFMIATGVAEVLLVLGVMNGFQGYLRNKLVDAHAHISIEAIQQQQGLPYNQELIDKVRGVEGVLGAAPVVVAEVMLRAPDQELTAAAQLIGVDPHDVDQSIPVSKFLKNGCGCLTYLSQPERVHPLSLDDFSGENIKGFCQATCPTAIPKVSPKVKGQNSSSSIALPNQDPSQPHISDDAQSAHSLIHIPMPTPNKTQASALLGIHLRYTLGLMPGQTVEVISPMGDIGPQGPIPKLKSFQVSGWLDAGLVDVDAHQIYVHLPIAQKFVGWDDRVSAIRVRVASIEVARKVRNKLIKVLGPQVKVKDWQERNQSLFSALQLERIAMFLVLTINILLAAFSITSTLVMTLIERRREIAILRAMGAEAKSIHRIFVYQGLSAGIIGSVLGTIVGGGACWIIATMGLPLNTEEIYYISSIPVRVNPSDVVAIVSVALSVSLISTLYPAYYASKTKPLEGLKG